MIHVDFTVNLTWIIVFAKVWLMIGVLVLFPWSIHRSLSLDREYNLITDSPKHTIIWFSIGIILWPLLVYVIINGFKTQQ